MSILTTRRVTQVFFFLLFLWFCLVSSPGTAWRQLRGWPVNWFLQLDPLVALGSMLSTQTLYKGLLWALLTVVLTLLLGRFFCGWVCPFGSLHHFLGYLANRGKSAAHTIALNRYHPAQSIKYVVLAVLLAGAVGSLLARLLQSPWSPSLLASVLIVVLLLWGTLAWLKTSQRSPLVSQVTRALTLLGLLLALVLPLHGALAGSLQTGLLDPIPLLHRSLNLVVLPILDAGPQALFASSRTYGGAWLIGILFLLFLVLNLKVPRFYCRFLCPLGALFGLLAALSLWRIARAEGACKDCNLCERHCEGACEPTGRIRLSECVLCLNCIGECRHALMTYRIDPSAGGEVAVPDLGRRQWLLSCAAGIAAVPVLRLDGWVWPSWNPALIRPPGALEETAFQQRCLKCGQCMRVCPTNIIHPAGAEFGIENLWTPVVNFRAGTSGCQVNCVSCSHICPTAALRPLSLDEKLGRNASADAGPVRLGTAFVDRGRCLPWAMDRPCIVCQETCPVSPKAIFVQEQFNTIRDGRRQVRRRDSSTFELVPESPPLRPGQLATGDYFLRLVDLPGRRIQIVGNTERAVSLTAGLDVPSIERLNGSPIPAPPDRDQGSANPSGEPVPVEIQVRLQQPQVDPERCIGCGICEHSCPVSGLRAIRVTADNESRSRRRSFLARG